MLKKKSPILQTNSDFATTKLPLQTPDPDDTALKNGEKTVQLFFTQRKCQENPEWKIMTDMAIE